MPVVAELYGQPLLKSFMDMEVCRNAWCSYTETTCDGGGNRDMARIRASDETLGHLFAPSVGHETDGWLPCGVCSVRATDGKVWSICPHRLFAFGPNGVSVKHLPLAKKVFRLAGFRPGEQVNIWSEISLQERGTQSGQLFRYRLDYVLRSTAPNAPPIIVEVMTCSTSGGNTEKGTNIQAAFKRAVLFAHTPAEDPVQCPTVNVRQVWARMASQLIAKSEAANSWGGRTIWIVQDLLADYIRTQTALPLDDLHSPDWIPDEVNMVVANLSGPVALYAGPIRPRGKDQACWMEILGAAHLPSKEAITSKLRERNNLTSTRVSLE